MYSWGCLLKRGFVDPVYNSAAMEMGARGWSVNQKEKEGKQKYKEQWRMLEGKNKGGNCAPDRKKMIRKWREREKQINGMVAISTSCDTFPAYMYIVRQYYLTHMITCSRLPSSSKNLSTLQWLFFAQN
jgi:hypothetical protein